MIININVSSYLGRTHNSFSIKSIETMNCGGLNCFALVYPWIMLNPFSCSSPSPCRIFDSRSTFSCWRLSRFTLGKISKAPSRSPSMAAFSIHPASSKLWKQLQTTRISLTIENWAVGSCVYLLKLSSSSKTDFSSSCENNKYRAFICRNHAFIMSFETAAGSPRLS